MTSEQFEQLYRERNSTWFKFAYTFTGDKELAEDVLQAVVLHLLEHELDKMNPKRNFESYMRNKIKRYVLRYVWLNPGTLRKAEKHQVLLDDRAGSTDDRFDPDYSHLDAETPLEQALREALATLTEVEADVICLAVFAKMKWPQIAKVMEMNLGQAKMVYQRAIPKLRLALESVGISGPLCGGNTLLEKDHNAA